MIKLEREINYIDEDLVNAVSIASEMLYKSIEALKKLDADLCKRIIQEDKKLDSLEIEIESKIIKVIALYQPEAEILRKVIMAVKINKDIERMGDHAVNIASNILSAMNSSVGKITIPEEIERIFNLLMIMMNKTIRAFVDKNSEIAKEVIKIDEEVDELRNQGVSKIIANYDENTVKEGILLLFVFKDLERIGDLLTNICEDIFYIIEGKIIEHKYK
ncbi:MAG: phosphate signaling complex protein PhoU [Brevinematia bacterium]|jgi:phosphate transport system protein